MPITLDFFKGGVKWNMTLNVRPIDKGGYYMKGLKKLTAGLMGVVMALGVWGFTALAAETVEVKNEEELREAIKEDDVTIVLTDDIELSRVLVIDDNGKSITLDLGGNTLSVKDESSAKITVMFGKADVDYSLGGEITIVNGTIKGYEPIRNFYGTITLGEGLLVDASYEILTSRGGNIIIDGAELSSDNYGVTLYNTYYSNNIDAPLNKGTKLEMNSGSIESGTFTISGNNTLSAGVEVIINDGKLIATEKGTAIYWPMEGTLEINGGYIEGGTAIEAKMGNITVSGDAEIVGTGELNESEPVNGGSSPEGSAILLSSQMYGENKGNDYKSSNELTVNIEDGIFTSKKGNAVTVYNTEKIDEQQAKITIEDGNLTRKKLR